MAAFDLSGRVALVTGANTGLGQAIAAALAEAGADIAAAGRTTPSETEAMVLAAGRRFIFLPADLSSAEPAQRLVADTQARLGRLDILVNNAGTIRRAPAAETTTADWRQVIDVNLNSTWAVTRRIGAAMVERRSGKIVTIASLLSFQGGVTVPAYTASKHAVAGLTRALANEWGPAGVQVNAIAPGYISTDNTTDLRADPVREAAIRDRIPAGRWGRPEDVVGAAVFLASAAADYVNGHVLAVDGGWLAR